MTARRSTSGRRRAATVKRSRERGSRSASTTEWRMSLTTPRRMPDRVSTSPRWSRPKVAIDRTAQETVTRTAARQPACWSVRRQPARRGSDRHRRGSLNRTRGGAGSMPRFGVAIVNLRAVRIVRCLWDL
jgi:hypothetical protein